MSSPEKTTPFRILSIDGGGFRGVYAAHMLQRIEEEYGMTWTDSFDLIAGTSTGSIIAAGIVCGKSAGEIVSLYKEHGGRIFKKQLFKRRGLLRSKYGNNALRLLLDETFGTTTLGKIEFPLIIPATDIGNGCVHVFKSGDDAGFVRDKNVLVAEAVLASCSAPTFFDPQVVNEYLLSDGGLWANSPALVATIDAKKRLGQDLEAITVLSIGTGVSKSFYPQKRPRIPTSRGWGFATRWGKSRFIDMLLNLQSQTANNMLRLLLEPEQILRLNFESDGNLALDDPTDFDDLLSKSDHEFTHRANEIGTFLKGNES